MNKNLSQKEFINRVKKIHNNEYDYSKVMYFSSHKPIIIICKIHGEFTQLAKNHLKGNKCPKCSNNKKSVGTFEFIQKAKNKHDDRYDYSKTNYIRSCKKIKIICKIHGEFYQTPNNHLKGNGCPKCKNEKTSKRCRLNTKQFILKSHKIHNNIYDYNLVNYISNNIEVDIICKIHGIFSQKPVVHLTGCGCPKCVSKISKPEIEFLDHLQIPNTRENRQKYIKPYKVDGYDQKTNTIYEFLGDYWHGNLECNKKEDLNEIAHKTFGELYQNTFKKFDKLKSLGYNIKYIWESDWNKFKVGKNKFPNIIIYE